MPAGRRVLIFVEDPGALNLFAELPRALSARGMPATVLAAGQALEALKSTGAPHAPLRPDQSAEAIIDEYRPTLYLTGTSSDPGTIGLRLVQACREKGIPTFGAVDAPMNARRRFSGPFPDEPLRFAPDRIFVIDDWTANAFQDLGYPREKLMVCGHPHYDRLLDAKDAFSREGRDAVRRRALPPAFLDSMVVTFVSEGSARIMLWDGKAGGETWMRGWTGRNGRTELAFETLQPLIRQILPQAILMFRLHPKDVPSDFEAYSGHVAGFSAGGDPLELVFSSDLVVGTTSMLMTEAALLGTPILCLINEEGERAWVPVAGANRGNFAVSRDEVVTALRRLQVGGPPTGARIDTEPLRGATGRLADVLCGTADAER